MVAQLDKNYHKPSTAEELTRNNVEAISKLEHAASAKRTRGDVIADVIANFCGRITFVWVHIAWFGLWIPINTLPHIKHFDPFPFQFLTLVVSLEAIFLTTFVMISQNRQGKIADRRNHLDLQINLLAEQENSKMLAMLEAIMQHLNVPEEDPEVRILEEVTRPDKMMEQIQQVMEAEGQSEKQTHP
ncbi:MAG: hypothetical protein JWL77_6368 [Chthonomonadaceae bacterium]|nr:hypothetical protein [Chthonomonadaceae bacterium]